MLFFGLLLIYFCPILPTKLIAIKGLRGYVHGLYIYISNSVADLNQVSRIALATITTTKNPVVSCGAVLSGIWNLSLAFRIGQAPTFIHSVDISMDIDASI